MVNMVQEHKSRKPLIVALLVVIGLSLVSLIWASPASAQTGNSRVRVAHLSPDAPAVDIYVNGNKTLSNVAFKTVSDYLSVPAGNYRFEVRPAGAPANDKAVIDASADLAAGKDYTVAALGLLSGIKAGVFSDDNSAPASGQAKIRVIHASPDAPAVDVAPKGAAPVVSNLAFGSASDYLSLPANTYDLEVRAAGTTTVALPINGLKLEAGKIYYAIAANKLASIEIIANVITPAAAGGSTPPSVPGAAPSTGAGAMASDNGFSLTLVATLALALVVAGGAGALALRSVRARK